MIEGFYEIATIIIMQTHHHIYNLQICLHLAPETHHMYVASAILQFQLGICHITVPIRSACTKCCITNYPGQQDAWRHDQGSAHTEKTSSRGTSTCSRGTAQRPGLQPLQCQECLPQTILRAWSLAIHGRPGQVLHAWRCALVQPP